MFDTRTRLSVTRDERSKLMTLAAVVNEGKANAYSAFRIPSKLVRGGEDFATVARAESQDAATRNQGGDLGWFTQDEFGPDFGSQVAAIGDGDVSEPFRTQAGWHIVQRVGSRQTDVTDQNRRAQIRETIGRRKAEDEYNRFLQEQGKRPVAINIEGEAGIGKTSTILQFADEMNMKCVKLSLSQIEEIGDLVGYPHKEFEVCKDDGPCKWIPESMLQTYIEYKYKPTGNKRMTHAAPEWVQGLTEGGILILDDYTRADSRFMQAAMEIIDRQEYISWKLPKDWHVILTTNPDSGDYHVSSLDPAQ